MRKFAFLLKPADLPFLLRLVIYGLVTAVSAFIARLSTEILIKTGVGSELNPFFTFLGPIRSTVQSRRSMI